jgi:hypothetical protein
MPIEAELNYLPIFSDVMASDHSSTKDIEAAKAAIREMLLPVDVDTHMHMCIDLLAVLNERDPFRYNAILYVAALQP